MSARQTSPAVAAFDRVTVRYGRTVAADTVSLQVAPGSVYALLGRNGAGKSSLVRCLLGQQKPSAGTARLFGADSWMSRVAAMARVGVVPEEPDVPPEMTARTGGAFCARLYPRWDAVGFAERLARFGVPDGVPAGRLSKGQRGQLALALPFLAHAMAVMLASRSAWLAADLFALALIGGSIAALLRRLDLTGSDTLMKWAIAFTAGGVFIALLVAGLAQVSLGRTDARRGHRILSLTLWGALATLAAALGAYTAFLLHPTPGSLRTAFDIDVARRGNFIAVTGLSRGRADCTPTFAIDAPSGRFVQLQVRAESSWPGIVGFAGDGSRVVWLEPEGSRQHPASVVMSCDLTRAGARPQATTLVLAAGDVRRAALSDDGRLIALREENLLSVHELDKGRLLTSVRLPARAFTRLTFASETWLRVEQWLDTPAGAPAILAISALDVATGKLTETGRIALPSADSVVFRLDAGLHVMLTRERHGEENVLVLRDAWTGERIADLARQPARGPAKTYPWVWSVALLGDGRIALAETGDGGAWLRLLSPDGKPAGTIVLGAWSRVRLGAEVAPGRLAVALDSRPSSAAGWAYEECVAVDLASGTQAVIGHGLVPVSSAPWSFDRRSAEPGSVAARLFVGRDRLVLWEPEAGGRLRTVLDGLTGS